MLAWGTVNTTRILTSYSFSVTCLAGIRFCNGNFQKPITSSHYSSLKTQTSLLGSSNPSPLGWLPSLSYLTSWLPSPHSAASALVLGHTTHVPPRGLCTCSS